jgi:hypothetical protein
MKDMNANRINILNELIKDTEEELRLALENSEPKTRQLEQYLEFLLKKKEELSE